MAVVVANVMGLAKAMQRDGSIDDVSELKEFTQGFTQARAGFDFIDVGYGKERADSKIRGMYFPSPSIFCPPPRFLFTVEEHGQEKR